MGIRIVRTVMTVGLGLCITIVALMLFHSVGRANPTACVGPGGTISCYTSVQEAIDGSEEGTSIYVLQGVYNENIVITKTVLLLGGCENTLCMPNTPGTSILDGSANPAPVILVTNGANPIIDGFSITGGDGTTNDGRGGGISVTEASATIRNNTIHHNIGSSDVSVHGYGGGIDVITPTLPVLIDNNIVEYNTAYSPVLTSPDVAEYGAGGGIRIGGGVATIIDNEVRYNTATQTDIPSTDALGFGGALSLMDAESANISGNTFQENLALDSGYWGFGGAIDIDVTDAITITNNRLISNTGVISGYSGGGGGIFIYNTEHPGVRYTIRDNEIISNTGIVRVQTSPNFHGSLFANGGGIYAAGDRAVGMILVIENNLVQGNIAARNALIEGNGVKGYVSGGGVHVRDAGTVHVVNNEIKENIAAEYEKVIGTGGGWAGMQTAGGLGVYNSEMVTVTENTISNNIIIVQHIVDESPAFVTGGAIHIDDVSRCVVSDNSFTDNMAVQYGDFTSNNGAPYNINGAGVSVGGNNIYHVQILDNDVLRNMSADTITSHGATSDVWPSSAGVVVHQGSGSLVEMEKNFIAQNIAHKTGQGGPAISVYQNRLHSTNDIVVENDSGGYVGVGNDKPAELILKNVTIANNGWSGVQVAGTQLVASLINSIVSGHNHGIQQINPEASLTNDYNLLDNDNNVDGSLSLGSHTIVDQTPEFVGESALNYRLTIQSPAIDAGVNDGAPDEDFEGDSRPLDGNGDGQAITDMGADEYHYVEGAEKIYVPIVAAEQ